MLIASRTILEYEKGKVRFVAEFIKKLQRIKTSIQDSNMWSYSATVCQSNDQTVSFECGYLYFC